MMWNGIHTLLMRSATSAVVGAVLIATVAKAQSLYGQRVQSVDGQWLLPVASRLLGSDEGDHLSRGSINAWDLSASVGTPVYAAAPGRVSYVDCYGYESGRSSFHQGYGCAVDVDHGGGIISQVAHCAENTFFVSVGQQVDQNTPLCRVGTTGSTSWPHVHFDILQNGSAIRLDRIFDKSQMYHCKFCRADNDPGAAIQGVAVAQQAQTTTQAVVMQSTGQRVLQAIGAAMLEMGSGLLLVFFVAILGLSVAFWLAVPIVRVVMVCVVVCVAVTVTVAMLFIPTQTVAQQAATATGDLWETAYELTVGSEGWKCTNDGAYTAGGITQGTYNAWRQSRGLPPADVCKSLTQAERKAIFYDRYWLASGAGQLPPAIALTYVDHAFNAGIEAAKRGLSECGTDARCYNNWRTLQYRAMKTCFLYCAGWLNRVNKFRKFEGIR